MIEQIKQFLIDLGENVVQDGNDLILAEKRIIIWFRPLWDLLPEADTRSLPRKRWKECLAKDVKLLQVFSDEWENKQDIVKSMIRHRLNNSQHNIYARKCQVIDVDGKTARDFFTRTHISGKPSLQKAFGLFHDEKLVACLGLRKPIQKKHGNVVEIARFSTELNTNVVGCFGKLIKSVEEWAREQGFDGILTYADLSWGSGGVYREMEFEDLGTTPASYWYTDGTKREFRFKYRAKPETTEKQVAEQAGVKPIYNAGNKNWIKRLK